ncbi:glycosyltransferase, partial [Parabacteroides sp.]
MKVAFYYTSEINPNVGGTERVTYAIAHQLQKQGVDFIYIALKRLWAKESENEYQYYLPNSDYLICDENIRFVDKLLRDKRIDILINQDSFDIGNEFCTRRYFPNVKCLTVIHYNLFGSSMYVADSIRESYLLGKTPRIKYMIQCLALPYYKYKAKKQRVNMLRKIYDTADHVVVLSEADKKVFPVENKNRIHVITNPVTLPFVEGIPSKEKRVLYVGRMVYNPKRIDYLLRAWQIVEKKHPDWCLDLLGDGSCLNYYKNLSRSLRLKQVTFHGNQSPQAYYERASIFCMTSSYEGFGLVLTEAMQAGAIPVAFRSFEAVEDIIEHGADGMLVSPFDIKEYAKTIQRLIEDDELRTKMSSLAQIKVEKFAIDKIGHDWLMLL